MIAGLLLGAPALASSAMDVPGGLPMDRQEAPAEDDDEAAADDAAQATLPWLQMPDDPIGRLWASVAETTQPWQPPAPQKVDSGMDWSAWAQALDVAAPRAAGSDRPGAATDQALPRRALSRRAPFRRAISSLVETALADRRAEDAYRWLLRVGPGDPEALAGLLPRLFPGVPRETRLLPGGEIPALPQGVTLRPQLPPTPLSPAARQLSRRATCRGLRIGESTLDLELKLDGSGVVVEFTHRSGPAATLIVELPAPPGKRLKSLYVDWAIQTPPEGSDPRTFDWNAQPIRITIPPQTTGADSPGYAESFSLFARLDFLDSGIPKSPLKMPAELDLGGLAVHLPANGDQAHWRAVGEAWGAAAAIPVRLIPAGDADRKESAGAALRGITVRLNEASDPERLAREVTSAIEGRRRGDRLLYR